MKGPPDSQIGRPFSRPAQKYGAAAQAAGKEKTA